MNKNNQTKKLKKHELEYLDPDTYYIGIKKDNTIEIAMPSNVKEDDTLPSYFTLLTMISVALDDNKFKNELIELLNNYDLEDFVLTKNSTDK